MRTTSVALAGDAEPLIAEKLTVLRSADQFSDKLKDEKAVVCPACGTYVPIEAFHAHIENEKERLSEIIDTFNAREKAIGALCDTLKQLVSFVDRDEVAAWRDALEDEGLGPSLERLGAIDSQASQ